MRMICWRSEEKWKCSLICLSILFLTNLNYQNKKEMESLKIAATNNTPEINFDYDKGSLLISGRCFTQNILEFYAPVKKWVEDYLAAPKDATTLDLQIEYMNSASTVIIANLLKRVSQLKNAGKAIHV